MTHPDDHEDQADTPEQLGQQLGEVLDQTVAQITVAEVDERLRQVLDDREDRAAGLGVERRDPYRIGQTNRLDGDRFPCGDCGELWPVIALGPPFDHDRCPCGGRLTAVWDVHPGEGPANADDDELPAIPDEAYAAADRALADHIGTARPGPEMQRRIRIALHAAWPIAISAAVDLAVDTVKPLAYAAGRRDAAGPLTLDEVRAAIEHYAGCHLVVPGRRDTAAAEPLHAQGVASLPGSPPSPPEPQTQGEGSAESQSGPEDHVEPYVRRDSCDDCAERCDTRCTCPGCDAPERGGKDLAKTDETTPDEAHTAAHKAAMHHQDCNGAGFYARCCIHAAPDAAWPIAYAAGRRDTAAEIIRTLEAWSTGYWGKPRDVLKRTADDLARRYATAETAGPVPEPTPSTPPSPWAPDWPRPGSSTRAGEPEADRG